MSAAPGTVSRLWEVDLARTLAIVMMVVYHAAYDVTTLVPDGDVDAFSGGWRALQVATGTSFLTIVGVSLMISNGRSRARGLGGAALWARHARRALEVALAALLVSLATFALLGDEFIRFGILHCIAASMLLAPLFTRFGWWNLPLGAGIVAAGLWLDGRTFDTGWLFALGFRSDAELGVDFYPLMPWFGLVLIGLALGGWLYPQGRRSLIATRAFANGGAAAWASGALGRQALPIYLVHQLILFPLVALVLLLFGQDIDLDNL